MFDRDMAWEQRNIFDPYINAGSEMDASDSEADVTLRFDSDLDPDFKKSQKINQLNNLNIFFYSVKFNSASVNTESFNTLGQKIKIQ